MAIKEASGDIGYAMKVARYLSDDFTMYSGNDDITIPLMSLGASGVISVWANVMPRTVHDMVTDYLAGRHEKALQTQLRYLDLINALFMEVNPIPVKTAMNLMGLQAGHFRMPMYPMAPENLGRLKRIMCEAGLPCAGGCGMKVFPERLRQMGRMLEELALERGWEVVGHADITCPEAYETAPGADVCLDFSGVDALKPLLGYLHRTKTAPCQRHDRPEGAGPRRPAGAGPRAACHLDGELQHGHRRVPPDAA